MLRSSLAAVALAVGCTPELGDVPFSCAAQGLCPDGYVCQSTVCFRKGADVGPERPMRVTWIDAGEMFWLPRRQGGAVLVINDGFTPGAHGLYEIVVSPAGISAPPHLLYGYSDEFPMSTSVFALDDRRYGVVTLRFPTVDEDDLTLAVLGIERELQEGSTPGVEALYRQQERYLGGIEPPYVSAVSRDGQIHVAWTRPAEGGRVELLRLEQQGSVWARTQSATQWLPRTVPPLSGDCLVWQSQAGELTVRVGFESFAVSKVDGQGMLAPFKPTRYDGDVPLYAFGDELLVLHPQSHDGSAASFPVRYAIEDFDWGARASFDGGVLEDAIEPHTATPFEDGALVAPISADPAFPAIEVGWVSPTRPLVKVASIARSSRGTLYSARTLGLGGKLYLAWTEYHEVWLDLWIATADLDLGSSAPTGAAGARRPRAAPPAPASSVRLVATWNVGARSPRTGAHP